MSKISKEELKRRKAELGKHAREELAKTETMRFRLNQNHLLKLYELAEKTRQNVGTMVRQWVLERMEVETRSKSAAIKSIDYNASTFSTILHRLDSLETEVSRLSGHK